MSLYPKNAGLFCFLLLFFFPPSNTLVPVGRKYTITLTTFLLKVVLSPSGDLAKGSLGEGAMVWEGDGGVYI